MKQEGSGLGRTTTYSNCFLLERLGCRMIIGRQTMTDFIKQDLYDVCVAPIDGSLMWGEERESAYSCLSSGSSNILVWDNERRNVSLLRLAHHQVRYGYAILALDCARDWRTIVPHCEARKAGTWGQHRKKKSKEEVWHPVLNHVCFLMELGHSWQTLALLLC